MKRITIPFISLLTAVIFIIVCMPLNAGAALPANLQLEDKSVIENETVKDASQLADGELYTYTTVTAEDLPSTNFTINLSALGQQYQTQTTSTQKFNIVFLLDVSNSMEGSRLTNMINAANDAIDQLYGNGNKISIISFATVPVVERALSTEDLQLTEGGYSNTGGTPDYIAIDLRSNSSMGGTNIQAGLNAAYNVLDGADDDGAVPVIILLSDGAPTYYYTNLTDFKTTTSGMSGSGSYTSVTHAAYTIAQAAYLKVKMENLQIYTIPFSLSTYDSDYNTATATLNPTSANLLKLSGFTSAWNTAISPLPSAEESAMVKNYPNGCYPASNSTASLGEALSGIIQNLQLKKPIAETIVSDVLNSASYLWFNYELGTGYELVGDDITVTLNSNVYIFTDDGNGNYVYNTTESTSAYNTAMEKIILTKDAEGLITWQIPASVLPCNTPEGTSQVLASPITLSFVVNFNVDTANLQAGEYRTSSSCMAFFTPINDNPHYYTGASEVVAETLATNSYSTEETYFAATYPYPGHDSYGTSSYGLPTLTGFGQGASDSSINFIANPAAITVKDYDDYYDDSYDVLTVTYNGQDIELDNVDYVNNATASFSTTDRNTPASYSISYFYDGYRTFDDAYVTAVTKPYYYSVTIAYNGGKQTITFNNVSFYKSGITYYVTNKKQAYYYATTSGPVILDSEEIINYRFLYDNATDTLTVQRRVGGSFVTYASYTGNDTTFITANSSGGYNIVTTAGATRTVTSYVISGNSLIKETYTVTGANGVNLTDGIVRNTLSNAGSILLTSSMTATDCMTSATLRSLDGTGFTTANSDGEAYVVLTFTTTATVDNIDVALANTANTTHAYVSFVPTEVSSASGTQDIIGGALPTSFTAGTYQITYLVTATYDEAANIEEFYNALFDGMSFGLGSATLTLDNDPDYTEQKVKIVLITPSGH